MWKWNLLSFELAFLFTLTAAHDVLVDSQFLSKAAYVERKRLRGINLTTSMPNVNFSFLDGYQNQMRFVTPASLRSAEGLMAVSGYQYFHINATHLCFPEASIYPLGDFFTPAFLTGKTLLDVGANNGGWCLTAVFRGCLHATGVEMTENSVQMMVRLRTTLQLDNRWTVYHGKLGKFPGQADIVTAFGVLHWLSGHSEGDSLAYAVASLRRVTRSLLLVEWVDARDYRIRTGEVWVRNRSAYTIHNFHKLLSAYFRDWVQLGFTGRLPRRKRWLYAASVDFDVSAIRGLQRGCLPICINRA
eukprot:RCo002466